VKNTVDIAEKNLIRSIPVESDIEKCVSDAVQKNGRLLIPILQEIQGRFNYLPEYALRLTADYLKLPLTDVYGVVTFYHSFSLEPQGEHTITVCSGTACHVRGSSNIISSVANCLGIEPGETTSDLNFSFEVANCLGCCAIGPIVVVDGAYYGEMDSAKTLNLIRKLQ